MRPFSLATCALVLAGTIVAAPSAPARANAFCPLTIATVQDLTILGRPSTYGVAIEVDPGDTSSVRLRIDSATTRYAVDYTDIEYAAGPAPLQTKRYFTLPPGERVQAAWVQSTGTALGVMLECPLTKPYSPDAPPPSNPATVAAIAADQKNLLNSFSTKTVAAPAQSFGKVEARTCTQPYAPARAILPVQPDVPPAARAVKATGTVQLRVDLDETSTVVDTILGRSSGFAPLDHAALVAAAKSSYRTETFGCRSIAASYPFSVSFGTSP
jgi:TonB family protein